MKYIIDADPGHDDAMAIMLAIKSGLDIVAITSVAGNSTIENTTRNARYILKLLNKENIPVYSGCKKPLKRKLAQDSIQSREDLERIDSKDPANLTNDAVDKILSIIKENEKISLIALGPLTNIAKAITEDPEIFSKLEEIVIMGGAINVPGNKNGTAEFNFFIDPEAADIVFRFPVKRTLIPLDACRQSKWSLKNFQKVRGKLKKPLLEIAESYVDKASKNKKAKVAPMYDPLAVYYLINPDACKIKKLNISVKTRDASTRGQTQINSKGDAIDVVMDINSDRFEDDFIEYLSDD